MQKNYHKKVSREEYLFLERQNEYWSEYINGYMIERAGSSLNHMNIHSNLIVTLGSYLKPTPCLLLPKMRIRTTRDYFYPDLLIICAKTELEDEHKDTLLNPEIIMEIVAPETEAFDRGEKFASYRELQSFREYLLVSQTQPLIDQFVKQADCSWKLISVQGLEASVSLETIGCTLSLRDVYNGVSFTSADKNI